MHTPQSLRDSPCGHGERIHQTPSVASRFALRALFIQPPVTS